MTDQGNEPVTLADSLVGLQKYLGTATPSSLMALSDSWDQVIGSKMANHCEIHSIKRGTLVLVTSEPAVAEQLRWMSGDLREAANAVLGRAEITAVEVRVIAAR